MIDQIETYRKICLKQQTELRRLMMDSSKYDQALRLFLSQHAMLHSKKVDPTGPWSFEDEVLNDMPEEQVRRIPQGCEHSVAWLIWHIARCEDLTINLLVAGTPQILHREGWLELIKSPVRDTGNAMDEADVVHFSKAIDIQALRAYRSAVGCRTREIVQGLQPEELKQKVEPSRVQRVRDEGGVVEAAEGILEYWSRRNAAGLLLMPATRHNLIHLTEALQLKRKRK
jgi:hypothetical protein